MIDLFNQIFLQAASPNNTITDFESLLHHLDIIVVQPQASLFQWIPREIRFDNLSAPAFNIAMKDLLNSWAAYLQTPDSSKTLTDSAGGWFSEMGLAALEDDDRGKFNSTYVLSKPTADEPRIRFLDEFFTREILPTPGPWFPRTTPPSIPASSSAPARLHRWNRLSGVPQPPPTTIAGAEDDPDLVPGSPYGTIIRSQPWLTQAATRALIYINNPKVGLVCFIGVGMVEVSTCALAVRTGQQVNRGDELGMFHFGGSSHLLLFGPQAKLTFCDDIVDPNTGEVKVNTHIKVLSLLAQAS
ncbi:phosphatidylserine decarboxylase [Mycena olivaceomarginata]|nr:phosphatidylserine decarboxylase [Mycena olivaceomarginata]